MNSRSSYPVLSLDGVCVLHDEALRQRFFENKSKIESRGDPRKKNFKLVRHLEIECCYLQRELQIREIRKISHTKYTSQLARRTTPDRRPRFASHN